MDHRFDRVHGLRRQFQQLRQNLRLAWWRGRAAHLALHLGADGPVRAVINAQSENQTRKDFDRGTAWASAMPVRPIRSAKAAAKGTRMTSAEQEIDRLRWRLSWEAGGPLAEISAQVMDGLVAMLGSALSWLRQSGQERPMISLLLAFEAGFAMGRWGGRHAHR
jgi:hypothetical protein